jgi:O-antigen/teichoic acid export membrane protein
LLIAHFFPARLVGIYDLGSRLVMFLKDLPTFLFSSMLPRTSELHSQGNVAGLRRIYLAGTKYMAVICFGAVALLFPVAPEILNVLFRTPIDPLSIYVFQVLLISTMINSTTGVGTSIGMGIGKPGGIAVSNLVMAIVNILCSTAFFYAFGPKSVVWGTAASLFVSSVVYYGILNRSMGVRTAAFWSSSMAVPFFLNGIATLGLLELHDAARAMHPALFSGIFAGWAVIAVNCIVALTVSVAVYGASRFITMDELLEYLPFLKRWRKA